MYDIKSLIQEITETTAVISIDKDDDFDFNKKDEAFIIESGKLLAYGEKNLTQTFDLYDPIGFAEAIAARPNNLKFRKISNLKLRKFDGANIRQQANASEVVSKSIIKYSLSRIFDMKSSRRNILFEEEYIDKNLKFLNRQVFEENCLLFRFHDKGDSMYFIEKGSVKLLTENKKVLAKLNSGECFGEAALISNKRRNCSAITEQKSTFLVIDRITLKKELERDPPLVRITIIALLKRLELMNKLRRADDFSL